ncbi:MAG: translation initiation factor IF-3 [Anaerolineae bacterium]|nr:translation initiation factor IF-3 [Anaerolineae bacterium]
MSTFKDEAAEGKTAISEQENRVNEQIRAKEVRLISDTNENLGIVPIKRALQIAQERELDLVEVAPNANPPVCRIMDYGKYLYSQKKKERAARQQQKTILVKEIRLRPKTDEHHLGFKVRDARRWLEDGMKVKVRIWFRGREITYPELGREILDMVSEQLKDVAVVEQDANMEGKSMLMVLAPIPEKEKKKT